jgi:hypothetical protein
LAEPTVPHLPTTPLFSLFSLFLLFLLFLLSGEAGSFRVVGVYPYKIETHLAFYF